MTYREAIRKSLRKEKYYQMPIVEFYRNMAAILVYDSARRLEEDVPDAEIGGVKFDGKHKEATEDNIVSVLRGNDFLRHTSQHTQFCGFFYWLLDQDAPLDWEEDDNGENVWFEFLHIGKKWNEYAQMQMEGTE